MMVGGTLHRWAEVILCTGGQEQRGASGCVHRCSGKCATDDVGVGEGGVADDTDHCV